MGRLIKLRTDDDATNPNILHKNCRLFTGAFDKNEKEVWEGDKLKDESELFEVVWVEEWAGFGLKVLKSKWQRKVDLVLQDFDLKYIKLIEIVDDNKESISIKN